MSDKPRILVVEDEEPIRMGVCDVLAFKGYAPTGVDNGRDGLREALSGEYDLLVLDIMLPHVDGLSICRQARAALPRQAILMLTARGSEEDVLRGFDAGADDYVSKPFSVAQLMARVAALLRRAHVVQARRFHIGTLEVDSGALVARRGEEEVALSSRDVELLAYFASSTGRVLDRKELLKEVWGYKRVDRVETRAVDMHMVKLRRKLEPLDATDLIETVRGEGYVYRGPG